MIKEKYKLSRYNVCYQNGDTQYIWNTYSNALLELKKSGQEYVQSFVGIKDKSYEFDLLKANGFIVYEQIDEFGRICLQEKQSLFTCNPTSISFVIALGMTCNYNCGYCFQAAADKSKAMTTDTAEKVAEYICQQLDENLNIRNLRITWFGGEPLLHTNLIDIISRKIIKYTLQNDISFHAHIITNGRFLDKNTLLLLKECYIKTAQITVDGTRDLYCNSKGASSDDFDSVIENICFSAERIKLSIRLNIPNNDAKEAIAITDYLLTQRELLGKVHVYFAYVCDYSLSPKVSQQAYANHVQNYFEWINHIIEHYDMSEVKKLILNRGRKTTSCGLIETHNACIGPQGELYKCEHCFGNNSLIIGNIWQGRFFNEAETVYYTTIDDSSKDKCSGCEYLPMCMGDCANDYVSGFVRFDCETRKRLFLKLKLLEVGVRI